MNKKTLFLILLAVVLVLPAFVSAQATLGSMAQGLETAVGQAAGAIVVILWAVTGFLFLTALGDPSKLSAAKTALLAAVIGTVIVLLAGGAANLIGRTFNI